MQIRSAPNDGKVWLSRRKILLAPFGAISGIFPWTGKYKILLNVAYFPWWANGPYSPSLGQWLFCLDCQGAVVRCGCEEYTCSLISIHSTAMSRVAGVREEME